MLNNKKRHIFIEGNIGAGKSTFLKIIAESLQIDPVFEPHEKWQKIQGGENLLQKFYTDINRWAYTFQTYAFVSRVLEQENIEKIALSDFLIIERSVYSDRYCFAQNCFEMSVMSALEWELYKDWFAWLVESYTAKPVGFIYLQTDPQVCYSRMKTRNRGEESAVSLDYLEKLNAKHEDWLIKKLDVADYLKDVPVLVLNCNKDFESDTQEQLAHLQKISEFFNIQFKQDIKKIENSITSLVK